MTTTDSPTPDDRSSVTRRGFLTGDWFDGEATTSGDPAVAGVDTESGTDPTTARVDTDHSEQAWAQRLQATARRLLGTVAVLVLVLLVVSSAVTPVMAAAAAGDESARAATEAREDALSLLAELEALDETEAVDVDRTVLGSISDHIRQGNISFRNGEYGTAAESYELASQQARAALEAGYVERAGILLNASQAQLTDLDQQGYATVRHQELETRAADLSARLDTVSGVREARQLEQDAVGLRDDVEALPDTDLVATVSVLHDQWPLAGLGGLLVGGGLLALGAWLRPRLEAVVGSDEPDDDGTISTTIGSQAGHERRSDD